VQIYPSDFGLERMANEEIKGPVELTEDDDDNDAETTEVNCDWYDAKMADGKDWMGPTFESLTVSMITLIASMNLLLLITHPSDKGRCIFLYLTH